MKIGILTHPQGVNYGGILQCYALCHSLGKLGHRTIVLRRERNRSNFLWEFARNLLKRFHFPRYYNKEFIDKSQNIRRFVEAHLERTSPIKSNNAILNVCKKQCLDAVIVGSDQVWRRDFALCFGYNYFLDFVPKDVKKMSYAASFGLSEWEYTLDETANIKKLIDRFCGVSLREESGVKLCEDNLNINPIQLIDPTMLLNVEDYNSLASKRQITDKYVFIYWLGDKNEAGNLKTEYEAKGYRVEIVNLRDNNILPSVEQWLSYIKYSNLVITDSFHGCVFSILYEKSFILKSNASGGVSRLKSLLNMLDIQWTDGVISPDYEAVDLKINAFRQQANEFLIKGLS